MMTSPSCATAQERLKTGLRGCGESACGCTIQHGSHVIMIDLHTSLCSTAQVLHNQENIFTHGST